MKKSKSLLEAHAHKKKNNNEMSSNYLGKETSELKSVFKIKIKHLKQCFINLISFRHFS